MKPVDNGRGKQPKALPKSNVVDEIERLKKNREERRNKMDNIKRMRAEKEAENEALGRVGDVEFQMMIEKHRYRKQIFQPHSSHSNMRLCVCIRKRPIFKKEETQGEIDAVSSANPKIAVHECKYKVDGITRFVDTHEFTFDHTFNENETTESLYTSTVQPLVDFILQQGIVTCFAYGQTGSGKTFTMKGVQQGVIQDLFKLAKSRYSNLNLKFYVSFFEIYGGRCLDLLNEKNKLAILEDKNQNVQIAGLVEKSVESVEEMMSYIEFANSVRTTHQTVANDTSSRSHAICQISLKDAREKVHGKLLLVDLAGSERAQDTQSNNRQRRIEGAEINKSLLALKECIRAMDSNKSGANNHVPFRASKLTLVLRDSFTSKNGKTRIVMIACVSPGHNSADHTLNTLKYADRLKDRSENQKQMTQYGIPEELLSKEEPENQAPKPVEKKANLNNQENKEPNTRKDSDRVLKPAVSNAKPEEKKAVSKDSGKPSSARPKWEKKDPYIANVKQTSESGPLEEDGDESPEQIRRANQDLQYMKQTMKLDKNNKQMGKEFFDLQEKINMIVEEQEDIFATHMTAIKEDAKLLTEESELISKVQGADGEDVDIDQYVQLMEKVIKKKLHLYTLLDRKISKFKKHLQEEEEISSKVKDTVYY